MTEPRPAWQWSQDMQTEEARQALRAFHERRGYGGVSPHDPEFLYCLDKVDVISRYQLLVDQFDRYKQSTAEFHESEIRRLKATIEKAGRWWDHCLQLRRSKRKTAQLVDMFPEGQADG